MRQETSDEQGLVDDGRQLPEWITESPYWLISVVLHMILLLAIGTLVLSRVEDAEPELRTIVRRVKTPPPFDPTKRRAMKTRPQILEEVKPEIFIKLKPDEVTPTRPKGMAHEFMTNKQQDNNTLNDAFGMGGGGVSSHGDRDGYRSLVNEGGSDATQEAVIASLRC